MKQELAKLIAKHVPLSKEEVESLLEVPPSDELGDLAFPCFSLSKLMKKPPAEIAEELASKLGDKLPSEFVDVKAINGYVNFFFNIPVLASKIIAKIFNESDRYGSMNFVSGKEVVIEYSSPNVGKPMHVGHIRSTLLGDSLKRLFMFQGARVHSINYLGDIGLHIGKLLVAYELWGNEAPIRKLLEKEPEKGLLELYVKFCEMENVDIEDELMKTPGSEEKEVRDEWTEKARQALRKLENGDKHYTAIWKKICELSTKAFERIYARLGVSFDEITGQSQYAEKGKAVVREALEKGVAKKGETGEIIALLEPDLPNKVLLRKDGTALYITQDLGAAISRYEKYKFDSMLYIVGSEQELYFKQLFLLLEKLGYEWAKRCKHVKFGLLSIEGGKLSTRAGRIILLEDVLDRARKLAMEEIKLKNPELAKDKQRSEEIAEKVGVGALKYSVLAVEPIKFIKFSYKQALNFEGNSGPYLQYSYVRASSILRKANIKTDKPMEISAKDVPQELSSEEAKLVKKLAHFSLATERAFNELNPSIIANYGFELCQS